MTHERIAAVVVTRNRQALLARCIEHLSMQTRPLDAIVVVDVASSDGTVPFLQSQQASVVPLYLTDNVGGAGGFYAGIEYAHNAGFDWIWCMDDDGYASETALDNLLRQLPAEGALWLNSLVVDTGNPANLAFPFMLEQKDWRDAAALCAKGLILDEANPFNGTLIHRTLVDRIGLPGKDLFIWGDEEEYKRRAMKAGLRVCTVTDSVFHHPASSEARLCAVPLQSFWKYYYQVRNNNASVTKEGKVRLSKRDAYRLAMQHSRQLVVDVVRSFIKIAIIQRALLAAIFNDVSRRYPK